ncbi:MAG: hypothetical protein ABIQ99_03190 [Thermoflexales bacterium]
MIHDPLVFDAAALFNFGHRDTLQELLRHLTTEAMLVAPAAVLEELRPETRLDYEQFCRDHLTVGRAEAGPEDLALLRSLSAELGPGEIEALLLARDTGGTAVIDDRKARQAAGQMGVRVIGTLGLIARAIERGWMTDPEAMQAVRQLRANGFFLPRPDDDERFDAYLGRFGRV